MAAMRWVRLIMAALTGLWLSPAWGASGDGFAGGSAGNYLLKSLVILLVLLGVMMAMLKLLRRYGHLKTGSGNRLRVVEAISLGGHERALLLCIDNTELLVGVSQGRVAPLLQLSGELTDTSTANVAGEATTENQSSAVFAQLLKPGDR